jgi:AcrR family transcriptional regulator
MKHAANEAAQDRRVRKTRKAIREALQTLLQDDVIEQITAKEIAAEADIGYTTFFRHFETKEAAFADLADSEAEELIEHCFPLLRSSESRDSCLALCHYVAGKRRVWSALLTGGASAIVRDALVRHTVEKSDDWPNRQPWLPADNGTTLVIGLIAESLSWWLTHAQELSPEQMAEIMDRMFISALVGPAA